MRKNTIVFVLGLSPLIAASSHFAYGILTAFSVWVVFFSSIGAKFILELIAVKKYEKIFTDILFFSFIVLYASVLRIFFPLLFISIEIYIYLLAISYIMFISVQDYYAYSAVEIPLIYSLTALALSLVREITAFGSISLPSAGGFLFLNIFELAGVSSSLRFFGSSAGALVVLGIFCKLYILFTHKKSFWR